MNKVLFEAILKEGFEDDYADYLQKHGEYEKLVRRDQRGVDTVKKIRSRRSTFEAFGHTISLRQGRWCLDILSDGEKIGEIGDGEMKKVARLVTVVCDVIGGFTVGNTAMWNVNSSDKIEEFEKMWSFYKEILPKAEKSLEGWKSGDAFQGSLNKRFDKRHQSSEAEDEARAKARDSFAAETPDFEEGEYAVWKSKNGKRKVTVVSIDEPNQRAKINTPAGATMHVPLANLEKMIDYRSKDLGYNDYSDE